MQTRIVWRSVLWRAAHQHTTLRRAQSCKTGSLRLTFALFSHRRGSKFRRTSTSTRSRRVDVPAADDGDPLDGPFTMPSPIWPLEAGASATGTHPGAYRTGTTRRGRLRKLLGCRGSGRKRVTVGTTRRESTANDVNLFITPDRGHEPLQLKPTSVSVSNIQACPK